MKKSYLNDVIAGKISVAIDVVLIISELTEAALLATIEVKRKKRLVENEDCISKKSNSAMKIRKVS
jgi:hypothetical protein